jgi:hypothetical protein
MPSATTFLRHLIDRDREQSLAAARTFVSSLGPLQNEFDFAFESPEDFGGRPASFIDIFPVGPDLAKDHKKFGGIFVRVWVFGDPPTVTAGIFLGAERAEQSEPRRGVAITRRRLGKALDDFERSEEFQYHTWSSGNFPWATKSSRAVARQLEQFISFREDAPVRGQEAAITDKVGKAILFLDRHLSLLKPITDFGRSIIQAYYSENLPEASASQAESNGLSNVVEAFALDLGSDLVGVRANTQVLKRLVSCLLSKRFLIATGLAGSGKTKIAQAFARWITPGALPVDPFVPGATLTGAQSEYTVMESNAGSVTLASADGTLAPLPRAIIEEWADYIERNGVPESISGRELRDKIEAESKVTGYLHRLESHYKPAAFALVAARKGGHAVKCYEVIPVGADWTGNENVLGYPNGLEKDSYLAKPALNLALQAAAHPEIPHFLILDEMNLSHVERYFADVLSAIESEEPIPLHEDGERKAGERRIPPRLELPKNLFIVGTVNVDETTYMFSPKVLDRANVIEFRMDAGELKAFLENPAKPNLALLDGRGAGFGTAFALAAGSPADVPEEVKLACEQEMTLFFNALQEHGAEFGYRVAHEAARFMHFYKAIGNHPDGDASWFPAAFDCVIVQKLLPKLHGSRAKLGPLLKKLWFLCVNDFPARGPEPLKAAAEAARSTDRRAEPSTAPEGLAAAPYPLSAEKIARMWRLLNENGFASFAEA